MSEQFGGYNYQPQKEVNRESVMKKWKWAIIGLLVLMVVFWGGKWALNKSNEARKGKLIQAESNLGAKEYPIANAGDVSPISGLACENWNRRPIAVMQPADVTARPAAGFSDADMVIEMPVITASITRLMGVYVCNEPDDVGSMRSARHDFIHLAKGLDAIFVSWGRSVSHDENDKAGLAKGILDRGEIENMNCNNDAGKSAGYCCYRKEGMERGVDSGYAKFSQLLQCAQDFGYSLENRFAGYPHQGEAPLSDRIDYGHLRVGYAGPFAVEYDYDKETNSYLRTWDEEPDTDRNNGKRIAPKNVVVILTTSEQNKDNYNNVQLGDPWYDTTDSGEAFFYMNGKEIRGKWRKDKSNINSKLMFVDENENEIKFVPGQIWVNVLEQGQGRRWKTVAEE